MILDATCGVFVFVKASNTVGDKGRRTFDEIDGRLS